MYVYCIASTIKLRQLFVNIILLFLLYNAVTYKKLSMRDFCVHILCTFRVTFPEWTLRRFHTFRGLNVTTII